MEKHFELIRAADSFCPPQILDYINTRAPINKVHFKFVHLYSYDSQQPIEAVEEAARLAVHLWTRFGIRKEKEPSVAIFWTPFPKLYQTGGAGRKLTKDNINSGETYAQRYVTIWRYQDWKKVLLHEYLHVLGYAKHLPSTKWEEAWTEAAALVLYAKYFHKDWRAQYEHTRALAFQILAWIPEQDRGPAEWYILLPALVILSPSLQTSYRRILHPHEIGPPPPSFADGRATRIISLQATL